jgi:hypothetical protein
MKPYKISKGKYGLGIQPINSNSNIYRHNKPLLGQETCYFGILVGVYPANLALKINYFEENC